ncbi:MAG: DUF2752 domain-containing protein [Bacteroidales bacterium]|nr:DUF2752 domain-containing protein [Bacteroidales bacterium]
MQLLPCAYKQLFGFSCPMCGAQRAIVLFSQCHWYEGMVMFPPFIPMTFSFLYIILKTITKISISERETKILVGTNVIFLLINFILKNVDLFYE